MWVGTIKPVATWYLQQRRPVTACLCPEIMQDRAVGFLWDRRFSGLLREPDSARRLLLLGVAATRLLRVSPQQAPGLLRNSTGL